MYRKCRQVLLVVFIFGLITHKVKSDEYTIDCYKCHIEDDLCVDPFKVKTMKTCRASTAPASTNRHGGCLKLKLRGKAYDGRNYAVIRDCVDDIETACTNFEQGVRELSAEKIDVQCSTCKHNLCNAAESIRHMSLFSIVVILFITSLLNCSRTL